MIGNSRFAVCEDAIPMGHDDQGKHEGDRSCVFCSILNANEGDRKFVHETEFFFAIHDRFPVNRGHTLIIPKRHVASFFDLTQDEFTALKPMIDSVKEKLDAEFKPDAYNMGINIGKWAGQTVFHVHVHLIPRYRGDVDHAAGGIRKFKQPLVEYE